MKQVIIRNGSAVIEDIPVPAVQEGMVLVRCAYSVLSSGTESASVEFSKKNLLAKILTEPSKVEKGLRMLQQRGFRSTYEFVRGLFDFGAEVGYSCAGTVVELGAGVTDFSIGDRVACAGVEYAHHAEYIAAPVNLCAHVPGTVELRDAASATIGAIAMQGVRQANLSLGESAVVVGLGLLGQLAVQMLVRSGVTVYGVDLNEERIALARTLGLKEGFRADDHELPQKICMATGGHGVDATLLYAATPSSAPLNSAMSYTRKRGRVVVIGSVGLSLKRAAWYEKEIDLRISTSYGPGRYDQSYERGGHDYPYAYVRWTEKRNMESYLSLIQSAAVSFSKLIDQEFSLDNAREAFAYLEQRPIAIVLRYSSNETEIPSRSVTIAPIIKKQGTISIGIIGIGAFATSCHLPTISRIGDFYIRALASHDGVKLRQYGTHYHVPVISTDYQEILADDTIDAVLIATRHDSHSEIICKALHAGKHVFVEKPLALTGEQLSQIEAAVKISGKVLMVGYNRRFAPMCARVRELLDRRTHPMVIQYRVNAAYLPREHWTYGHQGGGRIVGEACHMLDLFSFLIARRCVSHQVSCLQSDDLFLPDDNFTASLSYEDGSIAALTYSSSGHRALSKEYIEIFCGGNAYVIDDFQSISAFGEKLHWRRPQDKGHAAILKSFADAIHTGRMPIDLEELLDISRLSFKLQKAIR